IWVGVSTFKHAGPVTFRVTVQDTAITRFQWARTYNPPGQGMFWQQFTFLFDTSGWTMVRGANGTIESSGAIYIEGPRDLNPGKSFLGIDQAELTLWRPLFRSFS